MRTIILEKEDCRTEELGKIKNGSKSMTGQSVTVLQNRNRTPHANSKKSSPSRNKVKSLETLSSAISFLQTVSANRRRALDLERFLECGQELDRSPRYGTEEETEEFEKVPTAVGRLVNQSG